MDPRPLIRAAQTNRHNFLSMEPTLLQNTRVAGVARREARARHGDVAAAATALPRTAAAGEGGLWGEGRAGGDVRFVVQELHAREVVALHRAGAHGAGKPALFETA